MAQNLAYRLNKFISEYDPYEYMDSVDDEEQALEETMNSLKTKKGRKGIKDYLQLIVDEADEDDEFAIEAYQLIKELDSIDKPTRVKSSYKLPTQAMLNRGLR